MTKELPGLGSGALREALTEIGNRAGAPTMHYAPNTEREEQRESLNWIAERVRAVLALSSPIEPPAEIANLVAFHEKETDVWAEQLVKARERIAELEARAQASSEVREALEQRIEHWLEQAKHLCAEGTDERTRYFHQRINRISLDHAADIQSVVDALAPSRQGAAKRVEG